MSLPDIFGSYCVAVDIDFTIDLIVPRGVENRVAISKHHLPKHRRLQSQHVTDMITDLVRKTLSFKSKMHQVELRRLGKTAEEGPMSPNVILLEQRPQVIGVNTILLDPDTDREDFIFYFDRMASMLIERYALLVFYQLPGRLAAVDSTLRLQDDTDIHIEPQRPAHSFKSKSKQPNNDHTQASAPKAQSQPCPSSEAAPASSPPSAAPSPPAPPAAS